MDSVLRNYVLGTLLAIIIVMVYLVLTTKDFIDSLMAIVVTLGIYPLVIVGLYMFLEGKGHRTINGVDWSSMNDRERQNMVSYLGRFMIVSMIVLSLALAFVLGSFIVSIVLIVCSVVIVLIPIAKQETGMQTAFVSRGTTTKVAAFLCVTVLCVVPPLVISSLGISSETITLEFGEDGLQIYAPMADNYFDYDKIEELEIDMEFDKGSRIAGYGTPTISSGKFSNDVFGRYVLASYTQVQPCAFFKYEGQYYAFNQADDDLTVAAFEKLKGLVNEG